ncbi:MAG TPA: EamA family transporter, partial [Pyrinomonadaceae bacterium]|nr:EamA family transporter [Pyrinomonadaceae bacterium]
MSTVRTHDEKRKLIFMIAAFAAVYVIWGSTYLAIKYAIETMPTFLMAGVRFLVAGAILYTAARLSPGYEKPKAIHWRTALIVGTLLLGVGNGAVVVAEHYISSSMTALLIASNPFWMVTLGWLFMGRGKPNFKVVLGLAIGFIGVTLLVFGRPDASGAGGDSQWLGIFMVMIATIGWAFGSLYGATAPTAKSNVLAAGMQMLSGGLVLTVVGAISGEWQRFDYRTVSSVSWIALAYLIFVGALVAYTAYSWLIQNASPSALSTYAYVNPVVAVLLGWVIAGESMTA